MFILNMFKKFILKIFLIDYGAFCFSNYIILVNVDSLSNIFFLFTPLTWLRWVVGGQDSEYAYDVIRHLTDI